MGGGPTRQNHDAVTMAEPPAGYQILLVDDDAGLCRIIRRALEQGGHSCKVASGLVEARELLRSERRPRFDVVLLDLSLGDGDGSELIPLVEETDPAAGIAVLSAHLDAERVVELWGRTRIAIPKPVGLPQLLEVVSRLGAATDGAVEAFAREHDLSTRESEVLRLGLAGLTNKAIAERLSCREDTVLTHWKRIYRKTGAQGYRAVVAAVLGDRTATPRAAPAAIRTGSGGAEPR